MDEMTRMEPATPTGVRVLAIAPDGSEQNITEGVQVLYDLVIQSMDWGSGFLTVEDVAPILDVAEFCGFKDFEEAAAYVERERVAEKQRKCNHPSWSTLRTHQGRTVMLTCDECRLTRYS